MNDRPTIIALCGPLKQESLYRLMEERLSLKGYIVLSRGCFPNKQNGYTLPPDVKEKQNKLLLEKIKIADEALILNYKGYMDNDMERMISCALMYGKRVRYLEPPQTRKKP